MRSLNVQTKPLGESAYKRNSRPHEFRPSAFATRWSTKSAELCRSPYATPSWSASASQRQSRSADTLGSLPPGRFTDCRLSFLRAQPRSSRASPFAPSRASPPKMHPSAACAMADPKPSPAWCYASCADCPPLVPSPKRSSSAFVLNRSTLSTSPSSGGSIA